MLVRKRIELGRWRMLWHLVSPGIASRQVLLARIGSVWGGPFRPVVTLSARSALDVYLTERNFPTGSTVLMSGANIPDMAAVVAAHGLVVRAVDFDLMQLAPRVEDFAAALDGRTRAIVFAQLFGARFDLEPLAALARRHRIDLIEDAAQAFDLDYRGSRFATLSLFSFGPIKSASALGGGIASVADALLAAALVRRVEAWPQQSSAAFRRRLLRYLWLASIARPWPLAAIHWYLAGRGRSLDELLTSSARSFSGRDLMLAIREQASPLLLRLLEQRLRRPPWREFERRRRLGAELVARLRPHVGVPFVSGVPHAFWIMPVLCDRPDELVADLRARGFDATRQATMQPLGDDLPRLARDFARLVYLPFDPHMSEASLRRLAAAVAGSSPGQPR
jgi:dTDP-4-amino-4,6-dideoxygalactose transaminase